MLRWSSASAERKAKNTEQDQKLTTQAGQIEATDRDLSRTKERLTDTDAKAVAAGQSAQRANDAATAADHKADGAQEAANAAQSSATKVQGNVDTLGHNVDGLMKYKMAGSGVVLFALGQKTLTADAKSAIDDFYKGADGKGRFVIEVQGFTDKTGDRAMNEALSQERAEAVARYLANEHNVPLHNITLLGSGVATGDQKTREERKQSRKVEVALAGAGSRQRHGQQLTLSLVRSPGRKGDPVSRSSRTGSTFRPFVLGERFSTESFRINPAPVNPPAAPDSPPLPDPFAEPAPPAS